MASLATRTHSTASTQSTAATSMRITSRIIVTCIAPPASLPSATTVAAEDEAAVLAAAPAAAAATEPAATAIIATPPATAPTSAAASAAHTAAAADTHDPSLPIQPDAPAGEPKLTPESKLKITQECAHALNLRRELVQVKVMVDGEVQLLSYVEEITIDKTGAGAYFCIRPSNHLGKVIEGKFHQSWNRLADGTLMLLLGSQSSTMTMEQCLAILDHRPLLPTSSNASLLPHHPATLRSNTSALQGSGLPAAGAGLHGGNEKRTFSGPSRGAEGQQFHARASKAIFHVAESSVRSRQLLPAPAPATQATQQATAATSENSMMRWPPAKAKLYTPCNNTPAPQESAPAASDLPQAGNKRNSITHHPDSATKLRRGSGTAQGSSCSVHTTGIPDATTGPHGSDPSGQKNATHLDLDPPPVPQPPVTALLVGSPAQLAGATKRAGPVCVVVNASVHQVAPDAMRAASPRKAARPAASEVSVVSRETLEPYNEGDNHSTKVTKLVLAYKRLFALVGNPDSDHLRARPIYQSLSKLQVTNFFKNTYGSLCEVYMAGNVSAMKLLVHKLFNGDGNI